ncbi:2,3-dihydro-2,3-dihydroxybenzoate dehydrogenase [Haloechinothrix sp. LS1_15]|uniref:2,3-dihydro-2,3-dihydroxybenzoate dehydrogenase n=1 Tax=Haloechinothrix sp. LS1_15 TaxID=2652248 RepID=UPI002945CE64|nr:2,3-dihydro-2,3-dihydroxybenzoate dehydrogenase [Haloechinothrix sp. LS1_15]MDV6011630.1 2,3-dihydro-2,3-dihydroxybenzoate dehydrogenase [Haloechinothrix sp. LS1_15]
MDNTVALVTGAAGGIGIAISRALGQRGSTVAAVDREPGALRDAVDKLNADGLHVEAFPTDVSNSAEVEGTVAAVEHGMGPLDFLVNAAGVLRLGEARSLTDEDWETTFAVNVNGVFHMSRAAVNRMIPRERGAIVTVTSNAAGTPRTEMAAYGASKAAATMFTKSLGLEVARYGIRCNVVAPGSTATPMLRSMWQDESGEQATIKGIPEAYKVGIPLGKIARPSDVAEAVVFLLSSEAGHITLHALTVDGGASLGS